MSFLNPLFLTALIAVAIPLLIYLLNLRKPKRVRFSTLAFFDSLQTSALKRIKIKKWLLLSLRMLAVAALAIAASRPFLPSGAGTGNEQEPRVIALLIDNSPGMAQIDRNGPLMNQALVLAAELAEIADTDDRITIETTHGESLNSPFVSPGSVPALLNDLEPVNKGNYMSRRLMRLNDRLNREPERNKLIYLITAAREAHFTQLESYSGEMESNVRMQILKIGSSVSRSNIGYASVDLEKSDTDTDNAARIRTRVENFGDQRVTNLFLSLYIDESLIVQQPFDLDASDVKEFLFDLSDQQQNTLEAELRIEGDELTFDNRYLLTVQKPQTRDILVVSDQENNFQSQSYLKPVFEILASESDRFRVEFRSPENLNSSEISEYSALVIDGVKIIPDYLISILVEHIQRGAGLLFLPAADGSMSSYNALLNAFGAGRFSDVIGNYGSFRSVDRMREPAAGHPVFESIFDIKDTENIRLNTPEIYYYYQMSPGKGAITVPILSTSNGSPLFQEIKAGNGRFIAGSIGSEPGWSNFPVKPFFAPFFFRTVEYLSQGEGASLKDHTLGEPFTTILQAAETGSSDTVYLQKEGQRIIPEMRQTFQGMEISYTGEEWEPGRLMVELGESEIYYSVNQDAMESRLHSLEGEKMEEIFKKRFNDVVVTEAENQLTSVTKELKEASFGKEIWFWFITAAVILLMLESMLSRLYKAESIA